MESDLPEDWRAALAPVLASDGFAALEAFLGREEAAGKMLYPPPAERLRAFVLTPLAAVRVVILGQDPYHGPGQAMGLAFAVRREAKLPPSLRNIYRELVSDLGQTAPLDGDLSGWARQGVLLLNTSLSVEAGRAGSHARRGWEALSDAAIAAVAAKEEPRVFILWGSHAQAKAPLIRAAGGARHLLIESPHPSPLSAYRGFFGSRPFSRANAFLRAAGRGEIAWQGPLSAAVR